MEITSVIKYEGDNSTLVWKYPKEDFNTLSQLIVHESQEAVLFQNGQALDLFSAGRYTLIVLFNILSQHMDSLFQSEPVEKWELG